MRLFLICAIILAVFALIVASGTVFVTTWHVWLTASVLAFLMDVATGYVAKLG